jgi:hypothetical protein
MEELESNMQTLAAIESVRRFRTLRRCGLGRRSWGGKRMVAEFDE